MTIPINPNNAAELAQKVKAGEPTAAKNLAEALARIYADGGRYVQKTGQMQGSVRYSYAKEGDFIATVRPLMEAHGVTIRPKCMQLAASEVIETQNRDGGTRRQNRVVILATFELLHCSGDKLDVQTFGEGIDSGDKAFNKAMTGAMKYALRQTFCVETGDDPDDTPSHEQERKPVAKPVPQPMKPSPPAVAALPDENARWDFSDGKNVLMNQTTSQVRAALAESGLTPDLVRLKPTGAAKEAAKSAYAWGFRVPEPTKAAV